MSASESPTILARLPHTAELLRRRIHQSPQTRLRIGNAGAMCVVVAAGAAVAFVTGGAGMSGLGLERYGGIILGLACTMGLAAAIWPEFSFPIIFAGSGLLNERFGGERVRDLVAVKLALFACAAAGVVVWSALRRNRFRRVKTPADAPAILLVIYTALSAVYGFARGNDLDSVAVAGYHLSQLALYHFLITTTLGKAEVFKRAGTLVVGWSLLWIVPSLLTAGRGGGTATTWLLVWLCYATAQGKNWQSSVVKAALPLALLDTLTSGYRTLWVTVLAQLAWLAWSYARTRRRGFAAAASVALAMSILTGYAAIAHPSLFGALPAAETLHRFDDSLTEGGYRLPEAKIGLQAFTENPLIGKAVGYRTPIQLVEPMGYMQVGPIHHVYYVSYLSNEGVVGLGLVLWYFATALFSSQARRLRRMAKRDKMAALAVGAQAALFGGILGAFLSGPTDGHWTWGVWGAVALVAGSWSTRAGGGNPVRELRPRISVLSAGVGRALAGE